MAETTSVESSDTADNRERDRLLNSETRRAIRRLWYATRRVGTGLLALVPFWIVAFIAGMLSVSALVAGALAVACTVTAPVVAVYVGGRAGGQTHAEAVQMFTAIYRRLGDRAMIANDQPEDEPE